MPLIKRGESCNHFIHSKLQLFSSFGTGLALLVDMKQNRESKRRVAMKTLQTLLIGIMSVSLIASPVYAAPGGNGKGKGNHGIHGKANKAAKSAVQKHCNQQN